MKTCKQTFVFIRKMKKNIYLEDQAKYFIMKKTQVNYNHNSIMVDNENDIHSTRYSLLNKNNKHYKIPNINT